MNVQYLWYSAHTNFFLSETPTKWETDVYIEWHYVLVHKSGAKTVQIKTKLTNLIKQFLNLYLDKNSKFSVSLNNNFVMRLAR